MHMRPFLLLVAAVGLVAAVAAPAAADTAPPAASDAVLSETSVVTPLSEADFQALPHVAAETWQPLALAFADQTPSAPTARARAYEYSDAYRTRAKIHRYASFATLPLFIAQYVEGDKLFDGTGGSGTKSTHSALALSIGALFGVNSVTGVWNLIESRHDPEHRKRRLFHGLTMLGCDAGFVATGLLAPGDGGSGDRSLHRKVALTSMGIASANFLFMLIANR
jgi:hypothetical protein